MNKVVLITGVAGGIGKATANIFHEAGWRVIGTDLRTVKATPEWLHFIHNDISDPQALADIFAEIENQEGRLDAVVNNAAIQICKSIMETSVTEWDRIMAANVRSVFLAARYAHPLLKVTRGAIVNVSSVHAVATSKNIAAYAASKGALLALTRAMALEFGEDGIRVNAILPGAVDTSMLYSGLTRGHVEGKDIDELVHDLGRKHVLGRVGEPEEIGRAILFLADNARSSFMTGQALVVDGGATARLSTE